MLEIRELTKKYNNISVVNNVSFSVKPGEILGYLGPNGAGKTTTIKILAGLVKPNAGSMTYHGKNIADNMNAFKKQLGYLPEQSELYPHLTGLEYLQLAGRLRLMEERKLNQKIETILKLLDMEISMHLPIASYSKGMKQKILLTSALLHDPQIILFDEPLSGLDVTTSMVVKNLLSKLAEAGKMIIYSSHILEVVEKICTRVVILDKGKVVADDSVDKLKGLMNLPSLETIFKELVENENLDQVADGILSASMDNHQR